MEMDDVVDTSTSARLLDTLRQVTGEPGLAYAAPPTPLSGGFYAEMVRFRLADPPVDLGGDLVARIVPSPAAGEWEATIQGDVARQGFPTPAVRLTAPDSSPLGRYLIVMDHVDGSPPMAGLRFGSVAGQLPTLLRHLPDQLAHVAADLHALDAEPLAGALDALGSSFATTTAGFVEDQADHARALGHPDLAAAADRLLRTEPASTVRVIAHGDLHPFNLLITADGPALVDWTVARVAHPGFTIGFTELMLANPPIPLPRPGAALLRVAGRNIAPLPRHLSPPDRRDPGRGRPGEPRLAPRRPRPAHPRRPRRRGRRRHPADVGPPVAHPRTRHPARPRAGGLTA